MRRNWVCGSGVQASGLWLCPPPAAVLFLDGKPFPEVTQADIGAFMQSLREGSSRQFMLCQGGAEKVRKNFGHNGCL
jgi:hypothetical protein